MGSYGGGTSSCHGREESWGRWSSRTGCDLPRSASSDKLQPSKALTPKCSTAPPKPHQSSKCEPAKDSSDSHRNIPHFAHPEKLMVNLVWSLSSRLDEAKTFHDNWTISKRVTLSLQKRNSEVKQKSQFGLLGSLLRLSSPLCPMPVPP